MEHRGKRTMLCALCGVMAGFLMLMPVLGVKYSRYSQELTLRQMSQENLVPAGCISQEGIREVAVQITVISDEPEKCSVSAADIFWHASQTGEIELSLIPGNYTLLASAGNREISLPVSIDETGGAVFLMDLATAPSIPEYTLLEIEDGGVKEIPLPEAFGPDIHISVLPDGTALVKNSGAYSLLVDTEKASAYVPLNIEVSNEYGRAVGFIGIRILREDSPVAISTVEDLQKIRENPAGSYYLDCDLDLSEAGPWRSLTTIEQPFTGIFDGRGHAIIGLRLDITPEQTSVSFLGMLKDAEVRDLIFISPLVQGTVEYVAPYAGALAWSAENSLVSHCAVLGGMFDAKLSIAGGLLASADNSHLFNLFNSADVFCGKPALNPSGAGICSMPYNSYLVNCANEGTIQGHHLNGGITGYGDSFIISKSINCGQIRGIHLASTYLPGGINQSSNNGFKYACYYVAGQSPAGAGGVGPASQVLPITWEQLRTPASLSLIGEFDTESAQWGYASLNAKGPVPLGIFPETTPVPEPVFEKGGVTLAGSTGCVYFYTLDGSDPRVNGIQADRLTVSLRDKEELRVFCSSDRAYDSKSITITAKGGIE